MKNKVLSQMQKKCNTAQTWNGAKAHASTLNANLDFYGQVSTFRSNPQGSVRLFASAFAENQETAMRNLFYSRDIRGGQGERASFKAIIKWLASEDKNILIKNLQNIAVYGRWDDIFALFGTSAEKEALDLIVKTLKSDVRSVKNGDTSNLSLLAKWCKSETKSVNSKAIARKTAKAMKVSMKKYRQILSKLRKEIGILETAMSQKNFSEIDYSKIPSRAGMIYRKAFERNDPTRYAEFIQKANSGEVKMNASTLYPYEISQKLMMGNDATLEAAWKNLPNYLEGNEHNGLVIADVSASMGGYYWGSSSLSQIQPIDVCLSLAVYIAERNEGIFKDCFITFSDKPEVKTLKGSTLAQKLREVKNSTSWMGSTDLMQCMKVLLDSAKNVNADESEMPKVLYIVSDMQFNQACQSNKRTNFEQMQKLYKKAGYNMPKVVFWNVNAQQAALPVTADESGAALVSGCSPTIFESVLNSSTPEDAMMKKLYSERYNLISV